MNSILKNGFVLLLMMAGLQAMAQKKAQSFTVSREIPAEASAVWAVVGEDYGAVANSHPKIVSSSYINGALKGGEGAERVCNFNEKGTKFTHEKQIEYDAENYRFKAQVFAAEGLYMDPDYSYAIYKVLPLGDNKSRLEIKMNFRTKPAFMGTIAKGKFMATIEDYALAVEHHVKTGEKVTKDNFKGIKEQYTD